MFSDLQCLFIQAKVCSRGLLVDHAAPQAKHSHSCLMLGSIDPCTGVIALLMRDSIHLERVCLSVSVLSISSIKVLGMLIDIETLFCANDFRGRPIKSTPLFFQSLPTILDNH